MTTAERPQTASLRRRLEDLVDPADRGDAGLNEALAAVAEYWAPSDSDNQTLRLPILSFSLAVACAATGREEPARRILVRGSGLSAACAAQWCRAFRDAPPRGARFDLLRNGWLRPREDPAHPPGAAWALDAAALSDALNLRTEIEGFRVFDHVAEGVAPLWSETDGAGRLGLRGLPRIAESWGVRRSRRRAFCAECRDRVESRLLRLSRAHLWRRSPDVTIEEWVS